MGRRIVVMKLICSLGHFECGSHTAYKLSQRPLTAGWLAPRDSGCSWMRSKVSSDWLPNYIKATWPVLKVFKMTGYFLDSPPIFTFMTLPCASRMLWVAWSKFHAESSVSSDSCLQHSKWCLLSHALTTNIVVGKLYKNRSIFLYAVCSVSKIFLAQPFSGVCNMCSFFM
jgi:hypothetical protein